MKNIIAFAPLIALQLILMIAALVDIGRRKKVAGGKKFPWVLLIVFVGTLGPVIYFVLGRREIEETQETND